ncbi:hypothetical protein D1610_00140 [Sphingomonas gilva]|uniref:Uncharacterized protein n=1 Tax=Sphingomonas gilva TaxID=2305907 RepID=A0A396RVX8_9SPHN|nr:hypothetical protein [Sphingomonas gilva]RHW18623.1 hypothetical protein D1610_00140 [Sphingomonas gilva]
MTTHLATPPTSSAAFDATRPEVKRLLTAIPAFLDLPDAERQRIAADTVRVLSYMADPNGVQAEISEREASGALPAVNALAAPPVASALDSAVDATKRQLSKSPGFAGKDFSDAALAGTVQQYGEMIQKIDFPKFVGGLIKNVFQAIVESSIEQMRAYGELIANVAKTTDQFMRDNIGEAAGRDYLADAFPDVLSVGTGGTSDAFADGETTEQPPARLEARGDDAAVRLAEISRDLNLNPPVSDITDANAELRLVTAARLQMAKSRQQLLSSMVMLGINRIVVTDGSINAKVLFSMRVTDTGKRSYTASMHDREAQKYKQSAKAEYGSWYTPYSASASFEGQQEHVATVGSAVDETSEFKAELKSNLSGDVRVNFKSDYLPLEKMATPEMMSVIQGNSTPYNPNTPRPAQQAGAGG